MAILLEIHSIVRWVIIAANKHAIAFWAVIGASILVVVGVYRLPGGWSR